MLYCKLVMVMVLSTMVLLYGWWRMYCLDFPSSCRVDVAVAIFVYVCVVVAFVLCVTEAERRGGKVCLFEERKQRV